MSGIPFQKVFFGVLGAALVLSGCGLQSASGRQQSALQNTAIYGKNPGDGFLSPFILVNPSMQRLLLINFENQPDSVYRGFEIQSFDDAQNGKGLLIIAYRNDHTIDIYHQPGVTPQANYDIVEGGLVDMLERPLENARFEIGTQGADVQFAFEDKLGRAVAVTLKESNPKPPLRFSLLAPLGSGAANPPSMTLFMLHDFALVRRADTVLDIQIDGKTITPDTLPLPVNWQSNYLTRYAADPFLVEWNPNFDGALTRLQPPGAGSFEQAGMVYDLADNQGHWEIAGFHQLNDKHAVQFNFNPAFPDVAAMQDGAQAQGSFSIDMEASIGKINGSYSVQRSGSQVKVQVIPGGWQPTERDVFVNALYLFVPIFKSWPSTYQWDASIDLSQPEQPMMQSAWRRISQKD